MNDDLIKRSDAAEVVYKALKTPPPKGVLTDTMSLAIALVRDIPSADTPQEWIPCSERLPDEDGEYRVIQKNGSIGRYVFNSDGNSEEYFKRCATAWMSLSKKCCGNYEYRRQSKLKIQFSEIPMTACCDNTNSPYYDKYIWDDEVCDEWKGADNE